MNKIYGILLAAGEGRRAGFGKLSREINGKSMLEHVAERVYNSRLDDVIIITGYERVFAEKIAKKFGFKTVYNKNYPKGMSTSLKRGITSLPNNCKAFAVILGDMPYIKTSTINSLISTFSNNTNGIVIPRYKNKRGHPVIMSIKYKDQILLIKGDKGARDIIKENLEDILFLDVNDEGILKDIDKF